MKPCLAPLLLLCLLPTLTAAQVPDREMARCAAITEAAARLACLDALAAQAVARLRPEAQAAAQAQAQQQAFGAPPPKPVSAAGLASPDVIESEIEGHLDGWSGKTVFRLKNGQLWRVSDGSSGDLGLRNPKVKIRRNLLGTYFLEFEGRNDSPKVRRVE